MSELAKLYQEDQEARRVLDDLANRLRDRKEVKINSLARKTGLSDVVCARVSQQLADLNLIGFAKSKPLGESRLVKVLMRFNEIGDKARNGAVERLSEPGSTKCRFKTYEFPIRGKLGALTLPENLSPAEADWVINFVRDLSGIQKNNI